MMQRDKGQKWPLVYITMMARIYPINVNAPINNDKGIQKRKEESRPQKAAQQKRHGDKKKSNTLESGTEKPPCVAGESSISIGQASSTLLNERASIGTSRSLNTIVSYPVVASQTSIQTLAFGASKETVAIRASEETVV
ncbi:hypothetical protein ElyMa_006926500 [Elysia marginata]|uniref:Uncharacterized protein n=1 Tax=Elysia marginata TaxID=1093978 RepID=A0AAV4JKI8_9GAST|nr:hypothetical protein ElyMa_006926500 [Elysia marginata]